MKYYSTPKNYLILIAGIAWLIAGFMVMKIGFPLFKRSDNLFLSGLLGVIVFLIFYLFIFSKLVNKHVTRIKGNPHGKMPFWQFFDIRSYIIMIIMIAGGIAIRHYRVLSDFVIGFFYSGLGFALFSCGVKFVNKFFRASYAGRI